MHYTQFRYYTITWRLKTPKNNNFSPNSTLFLNLLSFKSDTITTTTLVDDLFLPTINIPRSKFFPANIFFLMEVCSWKMKQTRFFNIVKASAFSATVYFTVYQKDIVQFFLCFPVSPPFLDDQTVICIYKAAFKMQTASL